MTSETAKPLCDKRAAGARLRFRNPAIAVGALFIVAGACGSEQGPSTLPAELPPTMPDPMPGQASLGGVVRDANGQGVAGAVIKVAETDQTATADSSGAYQLTVPSDSTLTLKATATGMAPTFRESVSVAAGATVGDFDLLLLSSDQVTAIDTLGAPGQEMSRGAMAVKLHSLDATCVTAGALVSIFPPNAGTVVYSSPAATTGGVDMPDPTIAAVQAGTSISFWLAGALPPGNMNLLQMSVQQNGCQLVSSPTSGSVTYPGLRQVAAGALTQADLFLQ